MCSTKRAIIIEHRGKQGNWQCVVFESRNGQRAALGHCGDFRFLLAVRGTFSRTSIEETVIYLGKKWYTKTRTRIGWQLPPLRCRNTVDQHPPLLSTCTLVYFVSRAARG